MDIYEYLKKDHQKVAGLFKLFESAMTDKNKFEIFNLIAFELLLHAESEQATFYDTLAVLTDDKDQIKHAEKEHHDIKAQLIAITKDAASFGENWQEMVLELKKLVEHHVKEEEGPIFKKAKQLLTANEAIILKERMHDFKDKIIQKAQKTEHA